MTYPEYVKKKDAIARSEAPVSQKAAAIEELDTKFYRRPKKEALQQIAESAPDIPKLGGD